MKKKLIPYIFLLPSLIGVCVFALLPFLDIIKRSVYNSSNTSFNGIENYKEVLNNDSYILSIKNTFSFMLLSIVIVLVLSVVLAMFFIKIKVIGEWLKTIYLIPLAIPVAGISLFWNLLFDNKGIINGFIHYFGGQPVHWLNSSYSFGILVFLFVWKNLGFHILLWMIGISSISVQIIEAAKIDGANEWNRFLYIIFPNTKSSLYTSILLLIINSFKIYRESYLLAGDYPNKSMYMLQNILNNWFRNYDLGKMSAGAIICAIILCIIILLLNRKLDL